MPGRAHHPQKDPSRPPLILIHGAGGSFLSWHPSLRRLEGETVYTLSLPGHGGSKRAGRQSIAEYAEDLFQLVETNQIPKPVLMGHSMGGAIALTFALEHPEALSGLALLGAGAKLRVAPAILEKAGNPETFAEAVQLINERCFSPGASADLLRLSIENMSKAAPHTLLGDFLACNSFDVMERLPAVQVPTLILCGSLDAMTPPRYSQLLADQIPHAQLHLVDGAGHMLQLEQPEAVAKRLKEFLNGLPPLS